MKRPISITIIAWFLIISSVLSAIATVLSFRSSTAQELIKNSSLFSPFVLYLFSSIVMLVDFICGIAFLKGKSWSRYAYLMTNLIVQIINLMASHTRMMLIPGVIFFIVIIMFLFIPKNTNAFFKEGTT